MTKNAQITRLKKIAADLSELLEGLHEEIAGLESGEQAETYGAKAEDSSTPENPPPVVP